MVSIWLKKKTAKFLVLVMMITNISPAFTMKLDINDRRTTKTDFYAQQLALHVETQELPFCSFLVIKVTDDQTTITIKNILDAEKRFQKKFLIIQGIGRLFFNGNDTISIDINSHSNKTLKLITDRNVVINSLRSDNMQIIAPTVKFRGEAFVKSLGIKVSAPNGSVKIEESSKLNIKNKLSIENDDSNSSSNPSYNFNFFNKGTIIADNDIFLRNIGYLHNKGNLTGKNVDLDVNVLENSGKIDGKTLAVTAYKSLLNHGRISSRNATFVVTSAESTSANYGNIRVSNAEMQIAGTFQNNGYIEADTCGKFFGKITKLINNKKINAWSGKLTVDSGENYDDITLDTFTINKEFKNNDYLRAKYFLGVGKLENYSLLSPFLDGEIVIGVKELMNESQSIFEGTLRFIHGIETLENKGTLSADSIIFENAKLKIKNEENAIIKAAKKIEGEVKSFENKGYFLSEGSFISLFFETFINRGQLGAPNGVIFSGTTLRNYGELVLLTPHIKHLFNGESITAEDDDSFFAHSSFPAISQQTAEEILALPEDQRTRIISDILAKIKDSNLLQSEYAHISAFLKQSAEPQYSPETFPLLFTRPKFRESILHISIDDLNQKNLEEFYLQNMIDCVATLPSERNSSQEKSPHANLEEKRANLEEKLQTLLSLRFNPIQLWLAKNILPEIQAAIKEAEKKEFDDFYKDIKDPEANPIKELKRLLSVSRKMSVPKTAANLRIYSGSSIQELENTGHIEFISGINSIGRYIGTEASELLIPDADNIARQDTTTTESEQNIIDVSRTDAKNKVILAGKNTRIINTDATVPNHSLMPISVYQEEYKDSVFKRKIGDGELFTHPTRQKDGSKETHIATDDEPLLTEEQFAKERQGVDATELAYCINWDNKSLSQKLQDHTERYKILVKYALSYRAMADLLTRDMHIAKMKGAAQLAEEIKKCFITLISDRRAWVACYYNNVYEQQYATYQHNRTGHLLFGGTAPSPVKIPTQRGIVKCFSLPNSPTPKLPSGGEYYEKEAQARAERFAKSMRKKEIAQKIAQRKSATTTSTATAVSFGILEGRGKFNSHKMRLPSWQQLNEATFLAREMEIIGAVSNSKNIAMPMTKLTLDMQCADFHNSGEIACQSLFAKNCATFENRGIIEAYGNIEVHADNILNEGEPTIIQRSTNDVPHKYFGLVKGVAYYHEIDISNPHGILKSRTLHEIPNIFDFRTFSRTFIRSNSAKLFLNSNNLIKNSYSSIFAFNGFYLEVLEGKIENIVGRICSINMQSASHIKAQQFIQLDSKELVKKDIGTFDSISGFRRYIWDRRNQPMWSYFNINDQSKVFAGSDLHLETVPMITGGDISARGRIFSSVPVGREHDQSPINPESLGINAELFLAKFGLRLSETGEIVEHDSDSPKYSILPKSETNLSELIAKAKESKQTFSKTKERQGSDPAAPQTNTLIETELSPKEELAKTVFKFEKEQEKTNVDALKSAKNIEKELEAKKSNILDTLQFVKNIGDNLTSKVTKEIGKEEIEKIINFHSSDSKSSRDRLAIILGNTIKELTQKKKDLKLEKTTMQNPISKALLREKYKIIDTELSQNLCILEFFEELALIEEEEEAVSKWKMAKRANALYDLPISEYMTNCGTMKDELQIRKEVQEKVSEKFNSYRGDNYNNYNIFWSDTKKATGAEMLHSLFREKTMDTAEEDVLNNLINDLRKELISTLMDINNKNIEPERN